RASRHDAQGIAPAQDAHDELFLPRSERIITEGFAQSIQSWLPKRANFFLSPRGGELGEPFEFCESLRVKQLSPTLEQRSQPAQLAVRTANQIDVVFTFKDFPKPLHTRTHA